MESRVREEMAALRHTHTLAEMRLELVLVEMLLGEIKKYSPSQPRVPAGSSDGGQWTSDGGGSGKVIKPNPNNKNPRDKKPEQVKPMADSHAKPRIIHVIGEEGKPIGSIEVPIREEHFRRREADVDSSAKKPYEPSDSYKPDEFYKIGLETFGKSTAEDLKKYDNWIEEVANNNEIDPNLIRGVITNERITRLGGGYLEAIPSAIGEAFTGFGTFGPAQLGTPAREDNHMSILDAMTYEGAIEGAGKWLGKERRKLIEQDGVANPTNFQIAVRYNSSSWNIYEKPKKPYGFRVVYLIDTLYNNK